MGLLEIFAGFSLSPATVLLVLFLCFLVHFLVWRDRRNLPPAPRFRLPVLGHMHYMGTDMRPTCRKLRAELGDMFRLQLGSRLGIVIGGYSNVKDAFVKQADVFAERPPLYTLDAVIQDKGFVNRNGEPWKEHRRFVLSTLKDLGMGKQALETKIQKEAAVLVQLMKETKGGPFYPRPIVNTTVTNVISSMLFGDTFQHGDSLITGMLAIVEENLRYAPIAGILNFFPFLLWLPGDLFRLKKLVSNANKVHQFCRDIVMEHKQRSDIRSSDDLASAYLLALEEKTVAGQATSFSIDNLGGTIADLFMAGSETTTTAITWSIACLALYPEVQKRLHEHIEQTIGADAVPSVADRARLPYVEAFYMEILRFCNLTPLLMPHATSRDTQLNGYTIPKDAILFVDVDSVFNDPAIWGDPENFRPERFLGDDGKLIKKDEFIAFFFGKRSCVGEALARMELFIILITLVQNFRFECPDDRKLNFEMVDGQFGVSHGPKRYEIVAKQRK